jgi:hypothetical protein
MLELSLCQEHQEEVWKSYMVFFKDQHKGHDECVKDFWNGCCGSSMFDGLGVLR